MELHTPIPTAGAQTACPSGNSSGNDNDDLNGGERVRERQEGVAVKERAKTKKPPMYRVLLHNDDYTTKEFVVLVLHHIFHRSEGDAAQIMMHVHNNGVGVAGVYPFEVAETKIDKTATLAKKYEYPLQLSLEPESD